MKQSSMSRRDFVRLGAGAAVAGAVVKSTLLEPAMLDAQPRIFGTGRKIRFGVIGTGMRGCPILRTAKKLPNADFIALADIYSMHRRAGQEAWGPEGDKVKTYVDYRELLDRKDIEAVFVAVPDHLHRRIVIDAVNAGKDVYCEKPMSHTVEDGFAMVEAVKKNKRILQVGSQGASDLLHLKAREIVASGKLGEISLIEASSDRNSDFGAWVYPIPKDASPETIDWKKFIQDAPDRPYDPYRFFRWRCFNDYGEGQSGDLFVHLLTAIQTITSINEAPSRAVSAGSLTHFKSTRECPDLLVSLFTYGDVTVKLHGNMNNGWRGGTIIHGKEATLTMDSDGLTITPQDSQKFPNPETYAMDGWTSEALAEWMADWNSKHPYQYETVAETERYHAAPGYDSNVDHIGNFLRAVETRQEVLEDVVFGNHCSIACHMANHSYYKDTVAHWDAATKCIKG